MQRASLLRSPPMAGPTSQRYRRAEDIALHLKREYADVDIVR